MSIGPEEIAVGAAAWETTKQLVPRVFGPTADYFGAQILDSVKAKENTGRVLTKAMRKLGHRAEEPGSVKAKVAKAFLEEAPFAEDEITAEYLSGVLAASRDAEPHDFGAGWISTIGRLSTHSLKAHYLLYRAIREKYDGADLNIGVDAPGMELVVSAVELATAIGMGESDYMAAAITRIDQELSREDLIDQVSMGNTKFYEQQHPGKTIPWPVFLQFRPTVTGVSLLLLVSGYRDLKECQRYGGNVNWRWAYARGCRDSAMVAKSSR